jgi:hypothetical protein
MQEAHLLGQVTEVWTRENLERRLRDRDEEILGE